MEFIVKAEGAREVRGAYNTALSIRKHHEDAEIYLFTNDQKYLGDPSVFTEVGGLSNYKQLGVEITPGALLLKPWTIKSKGKTVFGDGFTIWDGEEETKTTKGVFNGGKIYDRYSDIKKEYQLFKIVQGVTWPQYWRWYDAIIRNEFKKGYQSIYV